MKSMQNEKSSMPDEKVASGATVAAANAASNARRGRTADDEALLEGA